MSNSRICNVAVYYRDLPLVLSGMISKDGAMTVSKNGIMRIEGHDCPRLTIHIESVGNEAADKKRIKKLSSLLVELASNNQIVGFSSPSLFSV
jgi:hypothetical protein